MLEEMRGNIARMIALYEAEKQRADTLSSSLSQSRAMIESYKLQITDLNQQIEKFGLASAFTSSGEDNKAGRERIQKLILEIDKCIKLLEK